MRRAGSAPLVAAVPAVALLAAVLGIATLGVAPPGTAQSRPPAAQGSAAPQPPAPAAPAETAAPPADPSRLTFGPLSIAFPKPERVFLPNGLLVFLFEDHELPLVDLAFYLRAGSIYDPPDKAGLADMATLLMRAGGTADLDPDALERTLDAMPARVSIAADEDAVHGSLSTLKGRFPEALRILSGMLRAPRLDAARLDLEKARAVEEIRRRWDDPAETADLNFRLLVYGASSPWARLSSAESIGRIGRPDLAAFVETYVRPNNLVMGVAGDFEASEMKRLLRDVFGGWRNAKVTPPPVAKIKDVIPVGVHLIDRPVAQSSIEIGHLGANRFDPDKFPLKILNYILGEGGFDSRLVKEVRSTRGLAYSVGGGVGIDSDRGLFQISCRTKPGSTVEAIRVIRDLLKQIREAGPTDEEVRQAKEASINSFVFSVDGTVPYMGAYLYYNYYGYPVDFLQSYRDNLARVTRDQVTAAARKHLDPERLVVLVVGDPPRFDRPLVSLGLGDPRPVALDAPAPAGS